MGAAVEGSMSFNAMPDDPAATVCARRRECMNRALEAVAYMRLAVHDHLEGFVVLVPTHLTGYHRRLSSPRMVTVRESGTVTRSLHTK